jgi:hypothetical protein
MAEITYIDPQTDEVHRTVVNLNNLISITAFTRVRDGVQITLPHLTFSNQQFVTGYLLNDVWEDFVAGYFPMQGTSTELPKAIGDLGLLVAHLKKTRILTNSPEMQKMVEECEKEEQIMQKFKDLCENRKASIRSYEDFLDQSAPPDSDGGYREQPPY